MTEFEPVDPAAPQSRMLMVLEPQSPRPSLLRSETTAAFVSQLLAARDSVAPQRQGPRNTVQSALGAYSAGASVGVLRMPQGYRKTVVA